jgi:Ser/Thr protein kinase RdoA (MazF antagonist)
VWPDTLDVRRMKALVAGYHDEAEPLSADELAAVPWLMVEALILESVMPIAATGRFGPLSGHAFLGMVERKVRWIRKRARKLVEYLG